MFLNNNNMNISRDPSKPRLQWKSQHQMIQVHGKHLEVSSTFENLPFKTRKICQNFDPNLMASGPRAMKEVVSSSMKAKPCLPQYQGFHDDFERFYRMFCNGRSCSYGDRCRFLHVIPDQIRDISIISVVPGAALVNQNGGSGELGFKGFASSLSAGEF